MSKITVLIPVHNGENFIAEALRSIEMQDCRDFKVLVSNNCSTDGTAAIIADFAKRIPIDVVTHAKKKTMVENFNFVFESVITPYCMFLCHDDCLSASDALSTALKVMEDNPDVTGVFCDLNYIDAKGKVLMRRPFNRSGRLTGDELGRASILQARNLFGIPVLMRNSAIAGLRGTEQYSYVGDVEYYWRMSQKGPVYHVPRALLANRYHGGNSTWKLLSLAKKQFFLMAESHGIKLSAYDKARISLTILVTDIQKRLFGLYAQYRERIS
ncbi:MAG TPA: glycosyltransferase family 2 protein [Dongiaceae bacterium]|nr:glycosyltransferase family 2 protein [Dongiaceae bacterium]